MDTADNKCPCCGYVKGDPLPPPRDCGSAPTGARRIRITFFGLCIMEEQVEHFDGCRTWRRLSRWNRPHILSVK